MYVCMYVCIYIYSNQKVACPYLHGMHVYVCVYMCIYVYIDYLLTECEVCSGKYFPESFVQTERRRSEVCAEKP